MDVEQLLRQNFQDRAEQVPGPGGDLHHAVTEGYRQQRRRRNGLIGAGLAVAFVVAGAPWGLAALTGPQGERATSVDAATGGEDARPGSGLYDVPTRGSLAADGAFLAQVAELSWEDGVPREPGEAIDPPIATRRVLFAGEVPGGQVWALVMGRVGSQLYYAWFADTDPSHGRALALAWGPDPASFDRPMALMDSAGDQGPLVVVSMPGDAVEFSARVDPDASGQATRQYQPMESIDGVSIGVVETPAAPLAAELQVIRDGSVAYTLPPQQFDSSEPLVSDATYVPPPNAPDDALFGRLMAGCLAPRGYTVTVLSNGGFQYDAIGSTDDAVAFNAAIDQCATALGYK